jgi:hypothetical protein
MNPLKSMIAPIVAALRSAYQEQIAAIANEIRPGFEWGTFRAYRTDPDDKTGDSPQWKLERLVAERLGLLTTEIRDDFGGIAIDGDEELAYLVLALSPRGCVANTSESSDHPCSYAREAASWDVIVFAREHGWYQATSDEVEDPATRSWCPGCGHHAEHHDDDGCRCGGDCSCKAAHTPHVPGVRVPAAA